MTEVEQVESATDVEDSGSVAYEVMEATGIDLDGLNLELKPSVSVLVICYRK